MKLAMLVLCHKNPDQINKFIDVLSCDNIDFFIHVDKKSDIIDRITAKRNVFFIPEDKRINVKWATFSMVQAELQLIEAAYYYDAYDYFWLVSGQDYPLSTPEKIIKILKSNPDTIYMNVSYSNNNTKKSNLDKRHEIFFPDWILKKDFIHRIIRRLWIELTGGYKHTYKLFRRKDSSLYKYYYGSQWWCLSRHFVEYALNYINDNPRFINSFYHSSCPDESFFQTILMNSEFRVFRKDSLHYIDWKKKSNSPKILTINDLDKAFKSGKVMARKIDVNVEKNILIEMEKRF